jgi:hypothetical protein
MEKAEKTINKILELNTPKNGVDESITFSLAVKLFKLAHDNILSDQMLLLKLNPDFILRACNIVENLYDKRFKTNKKDIVVNLLKTCVESKGLSYYGDELKHLDVIIESLHSNGKVKKISLKKKLGNKLANFFLFLLE